MKAAILKEQGKPLIIEEINEPTLKSGCVKIKVLSAHVLSYLGEVFSGNSERRATPVPYVPGPAAIGLIEEIAPDVFGLLVGQPVFCQPLYRSPTNRTADDTILIGLFGIGSQSKQLLEIFKDGAFAEKAVYPARCVTPIFPNEFGDPDRLSILSLLSIAYGGLVTSGFKASQTVLINGATGNIGACIVLLAHALGASRIIAVGRDSEVLEELIKIGPRVEACEIEKDLTKISSLTGEINIVIDASASNTADATLTCIKALSPNGTAVLMGGVQADLPLNYRNILSKQLTIKGNFMFHQNAPEEVLKLIGSGLIDLNVFKFTPYSLNEINEAIADAPHCKGLTYCTIHP